MAKMKLIFDMDNPDDSQHIKTIMKANDMANVIFQFSVNERKKIEQMLENISEIDRFDVVNIVFERFNELLINNNINIDEHI
jgi:hypothetical protein